jgi:UDP-N-acetylmuramoyl-tripeptide--D-alanyl-D-alanine ligase
MEGELLFRWREAADVLGCELFLPENGCKQEGFSAVAVDSRSIEQNALFVALKGERTDGHMFAESAFKAGAAGALVRKDNGNKYALIEAARNEGCALLMVDETVSALQHLAKAHLDKFPGLLRVGITGSSGKTTTKEIAAAIIGREKRIVYNTGNLNSDIGLPLSVFKVRAKHEAGIFELGMNRPGEIAEIAGVLRPVYALITNVGTAHIGIIGTKEKIAEEKKAVFSFFTGTGNETEIKTGIETAFIPAASEFAPFLAQGVRGNVRLYARESAGLENVRDCGIFGWELSVDGVKAAFPLPGAHNLENAAAAVAIARELNISGASIAAGLSAVKSLAGRGEIVAAKMGGHTVTVINDGYNANPDSMEKALAFFDRTAWTGGRKIVVAGEMLELGSRSAEEHAKLFVKLKAVHAEKKYFFHVSDFETVFADGAPGGDIAVYDDRERLKAALYGAAQENDLVLLKGSRACALERILQR